jgi:hypothetical protein
MAVKRDYGNFAKASGRLLAPQVESLGYRPWYGNGFGRERVGWVEGFFLQQSQYGSGDFCVTVGIHVPELQDFFASEDDRPCFGLLIAWRLSDSASDFQGERWYHAKDKQQLHANLEIVSATLKKADSWFRRFATFPDVIEQYRVNSRLPLRPAANLPLMPVLNYGLLSLLNRADDQAREWLQLASAILSRPQYWDSTTRNICHEVGPGRKLIKPTKDDELRANVIEAALTRLES